MVESTEKYTLMWKQTEFWKESTNLGPSWKPDSPPTTYTCRFRGNTLVDVSPRAAGPGYPLYRRDGMQATEAPMKKVIRYIAPVTVAW